MTAPDQQGAPDQEGALDLMFDGWPQIRREAYTS